MGDFCGAGDAAARFCEHVCRMREHQGEYDATSGGRVSTERGRHRADREPIKGRRDELQHGAFRSEGLSGPREPVPCGDYSTVVVDSRKDSTLAGSFSGTVEITTEHTFIKIRGGEASTVGTGQIKAQGEAVGSVPSSMSCYSAMKRWGSRDW